MNKIIISLISVFFLLGNSNLKAQYVETDEQYQEPKTEWKWKEHIHFGGGFGIGFGSSTYINVSPTVVTELKPKFSVGLKGIFIYSKNKHYDYSSTIYGGGLFSQYRIFKNFLLHAELEELSIDRYVKITDNITNTYYWEKDGRKWINSTFVGGGIKQPLGERSFAHVMILWNLNETRESPYSNPVIRLNFYF